MCLGILLMTGAQKLFAGGGALGPIRFDEAEFPFGRAIDGLQLTTLNGTTIPTISFHFSQDGQASGAATISAGPGNGTWVTEPGIEGPTSGELELQIDRPVWTIGFGVALSALDGEAGAIVIEAIAANGVAYSTSISTVGSPGGFAGNLANWQLPEAAEQLRVRFATQAARFLLDDLVLGLDEVAPPLPDLDPLVEEATTFSVTSGPGGVAFASWQRPATDGGLELLSARLESADRLGVPFLVGRTSDDATSSSLVDADQVAWLAWNDRSTGASTVARFDGGVRPLRSIIRSNPTTAASLLERPVSAAPELLWLEDGSLWSVPLSPTGTALENPTSLLAATSISGFEAVGLGSFGRTVAWLDADRSLVVSWLAFGGTLRTQRVLAEDVREYGLASLPNGHSAIAWTERRGSTTTVFVQRFGPTGAPRGARAAFETRSALGLQMLDDGQGGFGALWQGRGSGTASDPFGISGVFFDRAGNSVQLTPSLWLPPNERHGYLRILRSGHLSSSGELTLYFSEDGSPRPDAVYSSSFEIDLRAEIPGCETNGTSLCLGGGRFRVSAQFEVDGVTRMAGARDWQDDSGMFWLFDSDNIELVCKVLDGRELNGHFWVFLASLSNLAFDLHIEDLITGEQRTWSNPSGRFASLGDTMALPSYEGLLGEAASSPTAKRQGSQSTSWAQMAGATQPSQITEQGTVLLGTDQRFEASVRFAADGGSRAGRPIAVASNTGAFWFFQESNLELIVKVLDGRELNGHHWVYYGSLSNVEFELQVLDRTTGTVRSYTNPDGSFASRGDTTAFPDEPP